MKCNNCDGVGFIFLDIQTYNTECWFCKGKGKVSFIDYYRYSRLFNIKHEKIDVMKQKIKEIMSFILDDADEETSSFYNGLEAALAIIEDRKPEYRNFT